VLDALIDFWQSSLMKRNGKTAKKATDEGRSKEEIRSEDESETRPMAPLPTAWER
jgi:hypothetical protein